MNDDFTVNRWIAGAMGLKTSAGIPLEELERQYCQKQSKKAVAATKGTTKDTSRAMCYNSKDIAELLPCAVETVHEYNRKGWLPSPCNVGSTRPKWRKADIDLWFENDCPRRAKFEQIKKMERSRKK